MNGNKKKFSAADATALLSTLQTRFEKNKQRHKDLQWSDVLTRAGEKPGKIMVAQ